MKPHEGAPCDDGRKAAPLKDADFYECGPDNKLRVCPIGKKPNPLTNPQPCRWVGTGKTSMDYGDCV